MSDKLDTIYSKLLAAKEELEKARQKMSDEYDPNEDPYENEPEDTGTDREFDPETEEDDADKWLTENDPEAAKQAADQYEEYDPSEDEDAHRAAIAEDLGDEFNPLQEASANKPKTKNFFDREDAKQISEAPDLETAKQRAMELVAKQPGAHGYNIDKATRAIQSAASPAQLSSLMNNFTSQYEAAKAGNKRSRFEQPSREDLMAMRAYTRPWEQRAREAAALKADPSKNPELARHGNIVEARNAAHGDRNAAYRSFTNSPEYKNADPVQQMEMDDQFEHNWKQQNPEHLKNALTAHKEAHEKGKGAKDLHAAAKDAQIKNIIAGGGHGGAGYSLEEGMQHAGGAKGEEGTQATIQQDPASSFAMGNQDFINQYAKDYANKGKKVGNIDDMGQYDEGSKRDINRILGSGPAKDPKFEKFFSHYYPLIGMSAHKTLGRLGLDPKHPDVDMSMLHEAGMHGLIQAMNDYDHDNPSKASFSTHAANKIRGLQMTAMKNQDQIPTEVRQAQKKFASQQSQPKAPKVDLHSMIHSSGHPKAPDIADRLQRVGSQRQAQAVKIRKPQGGTGGGI